MKALINVLLSNRIGKSLLVLVSGTATAQIITAVSTPVVTRLYTPEMIGVISVYVSFFNFWLTTLSWRYESALLIATSENETHCIFRLGSILVCVMAIIAAPILFILQSTQTLGFGILPLWSPLVLSLSLLGYGWFMLYRAWLLRLGEVKHISLSAIARSGFNAGTRVVTGAMALNIYGLFFAEVIGSWAALGTLRKKVNKLITSNKPKIEICGLKKVAIKYRRFAQFEMPSVVVDQLALALPVPIIGMLFGAQAAGWFGLARLLYAIPNGQIGKAAGDVFQMEFGRCIRERNPEQGARLFHKFSFALSLVGLIPLLIAIYIVPPIVPYVFGDKWSEMGTIVSIIAPWMYAALVVSSLSRALSVLQKQHWKLLYDLSALSVIGILYFYSQHRSIELMDFLSYLSYGMFVTYIFYYIIIFISVRTKC